ncbi:TOMM precursor leader peptide-binding protein [Halobacillus sp. K22]|uniref:TOMM precursor leader peptide-binding protein n=1 Tax=Halobacillus sp. K22 TaxID=3457431 RepID=UPI003FCEA29D
MSPIIAMIGKGKLLELTAEELSAQYELVRHPDFNTPIPEDTRLMLVLHDAWDPSIYLQAEAAARACDVVWLPAFASFGVGVVGPLVRPGRPGCSQCAESRRLMAAVDRQDLWKVHQALIETQDARQDEWGSETAFKQMAFLIKREVEQVLKGRPSSLEESIYRIDLRSLESSRHVILPDSTCGVCSNTPIDSASAAEITLEPCIKMNENSYRCRSKEELSGVLSKDYLDPRTGLLNNKLQDFETPFADVIVNLPILGGDEGTAGRTNSYAESEMTAILEGLERSCGMDPRGKRTIVNESYSNLDSALHPLQVGVHTNDQYVQPHFPFTVFHPDKKMNWVWGHSLLQKAPVLVPERLAYYSMGCGNGFVFETSNGCALGGSREEAIFHGMLEVLERDSFLMTWYARLPLPWIDPYSSEDKELNLMIDRMREEAGYDLYLYNATLEHGIPCIFTIIKKIDPNQAGMNLICAAGAHLDPVKAVKSAIAESIGMVKPLNKEFEKNKDKYTAMLNDSSLVQKMDDHGMLYGLPEAEERLDFLLKNEQPQQTFAEAFDWKRSHPDLTDDVRDLLHVFRRLDLDVIVVDQTTSEIRRNDLHCVKVLIPGMLPMTFGHHLTRITGLERVLHVPKQLGYVSRSLTLEDLNPYPHPFP